MDFENVIELNGDLHIQFVDNPHLGHCILFNVLVGLQTQYWTCSDLFPPPSFSVRELLITRLHPDSDPLKSVGSR